ncbi:MAG: Antilisterial bacteriocin subtilosin biosynthesis protein AlbA [Alphaproteobacteria bacterium MarineAlpha2_Bin1]|nr:MAG: Antilisterial bacteriocin subtilosin biosynthesis protein AlbA [Alphaproteobacteria bacterium MarineAlpha2_Bin1]
MLEKNPEYYIENFKNKYFTNDGKNRAFVNFNGFKTLWFNTGTLCNIKCKNCYIESSPKNDALVYIKFEEVKKYLDEIESSEKIETVGLTGGEPFMNPEIIKIISECLRRNFDVLVLTNAMRPMMRHNFSLIDLNKKYSNKLCIRVSLDSFDSQTHDFHRGQNSWNKALLGLLWLSDNNFNLKLASRKFSAEHENDIRESFKFLFEEFKIKLDAFSNDDLIIFPEMTDHPFSPEVSTECWDKVKIKPNELMCSNSRMVVKKKNANEPNVQACTLIPYDSDFNLGKTLKKSKKKVFLNHRFCSQFCVLGGSKCT